MAGEEFTQEEERVLSRYVSNLTGNVFVLTNLPEVIKGALFSRYSRSTKGLRRLLLDEFITNPELGMAQVEAVAIEEDSDPALAKQKAEAFFDRILDGYGDDSVGELGGVHVAIENVSNIATKAIQDCRIGGSPLEKSSRYVWFNKKVADDYHFLKEPTLLGTKHAAAYLEINRLLFGTYDELIEPMTAFFKERFPQDPATPTVAYNASIRAKACDALRGFLPASTLTNMGVFGNGRFFEALLMKLRSSPLAELRIIGEEMQRELSKVVPSFVRRGDPGHRHFQASAAFQDQANKALTHWTRSVLGEHPASGHKPVELVDYDPNAEDKVLASLLYPYTDLPLRTIRKRISTLAEHDRKQLLADAFAARTNRRHKPARAFENAYYTFDILADFGAYRDLQRHRILTQERQDLTVTHGYDVPEDLIEAGYAERFESCMRRAADIHRAVVLDHPKEAQYIVPFAYRVRWYFTINARGLYWLCELRSQPQGHTSYRRIAQAMYQAAKDVHPLLFEYAKYVDMQDYALGRLQAEIQTTLKRQKREREAS